MALIFNNTKVKSVIYNGTNIDCVIYNGVKVFPSSFTLYFNANGGSCNVSSVQTEEGEAYGTLPTPTRAGYSFEGWFTEPNGGSAVSSSTVMGASDMTLYAHWKANSVSLMDGSWGCSNNCLSGQSTCSVSTSALTVQTWGNYNASWWVNFTKSVDLTNYSYLKMNITATLYNRGAVNVYIDGTPIYTAQYNNISNVALNQNIASYTGVHTIKVSFEQSNSGHSSGTTANSMSVTGIQLTN